jgi:hypothetical protein
MLYGGLKLAGFLVGVWAITWSLAALFASAPWWVSLLLMVLIALLVIRMPGQHNGDGGSADNFDSLTGNASTTPPMEILRSSMRDGTTAVRVVQVE